jgi:hypothetical protein
VKLPPQTDGLVGKGVTSTPAVFPDQAGRGHGRHEFDMGGAESAVAELMLTGGTQAKVMSWSWSGSSRICRQL